MVSFNPMVQEPHKFYLRVVLYFRQFSLFLFFVFPFVLKGQVAYYREFTSQNGLPSDCVFDLASDNYGLMYIGTDQGVYSYNGVDFKQYELQGALSSSISSLSFTNDNKLWCRNFSDQVFYSEGNVLKPSSLVKNYLSNELLIDLKAINQLVYILSFEALYIVDSKNHRLLKRIEVIGAEGLSIQGNQVLVTTVNGYCIWFKGTRKISTKQIKTGRYRSAGSANTSFLIEKNKVPMQAYHSDGKSIRPVTSFLQFSTGLYINNCNVLKGRTFLSTNQGTFYTERSQWKQLSTGHNHTDLFIDFQGGIWISTIENGLLYLPSLDISNFFEADYGNNLRQMIASPDGFFVSTSNGIVYELNHKGEKIRYYDTKTGRDIEFIYFDHLSNRLYTSVGYFNYHHSSSFFQFYYGKGIAIDAHANLYFGIHSLSGVIKGNEKSSVVNPTSSIQKAGSVVFQVIRKKRSRCLLLLKSQLVIGYVDKLIAYSNNMTIEFRSKAGKSIQAVSLAKDDFGRLWVATVQDGVYVFKNGKEEKHFTVDLGLSHQQCKRIKIFGNQLFVITISGLDQIDVHSFKLRSFTNNYSLYNTPIIDIHKENGNLMLLTKNQIINIPYHKESNLILPRLNFKNISLRNGRIQRIKKQNNLKEGFFEISWDYLAYREGVKVPLYYRLNGFDKKWNKLSPTVSAVSYNGLTHGEYRFELKTGLKNDQIQSIQLHIERPIWLKWWFILLEILLIAVLFYLTIRLTVLQMRKKQSRREQLIHSKLTAIRSQMNPHFLYNVLNSLQGLIYSNKVNEAGNYVSMFSDHLRYTLSISDKQMITIKEEMESLDIYLRLEKLRFGDDFNYSIQKESEVNEQFKIPSMILQPFVENAVKHGLLNKKGEKNVLIHFSLIDLQTIQIVVRDNGIGREKSYVLNRNRKDKPTSFATGAILNRIELLNQHLEKKMSLVFHDLVENGVSTGTEVIIKIPIDLKIYESIDR